MIQMTIPLSLTTGRFLLGFVSKTHNSPRCVGNSAECGYTRAVEGGDDVWLEKRSADFYLMSRSENEHNVVRVT